MPLNICGEYLQNLERVNAHLLMLYLKHGTLGGDKKIVSRLTRDNNGSSLTNLNTTFKCRVLRNTEERSIGELTVYDEDLIQSQKF